MDNLLAPLEFVHVEAERFIKSNVCLVCLGTLTIFVMGRTSRDGARVKCPICMVWVTETNTATKRQAGKIRSDREFAAREIREKKPLTQEGMDQALKDLGFS